MTGAGNREYQRKAWYVGCLHAAKLGSRALCEAACFADPQGVCVCVCVCVCVDIYVYICIHIRMYVYIYI